MAASKKQATLRLSDLSDSEALELRAFFEGFGITVEKETEDTGRQMKEKLAEHMEEKGKKKYWMYYMLGDMLTMHGQLDEAIAMYSKATEENPADPRAWFSLGVLHRAISYEPDRSKKWQKDLAEAKEKDQKLAENMEKWEKQNSRFLKAAGKSKLAESAIETANTAVTYFQKVLDCKISNDDKEKVQNNIKAIEEWKKTK
jgi:tetratricopeptide (TPR) repeat protein